MNSMFTDLSALQFRRAAALKEKIDKLQSELAGLLGGQASRRSTVSGSTVGGKRRKMSAAARAKIAAAARARWKKAKAAGKNSL